jgi:hypothetical protein
MFLVLILRSVHFPHNLARSAVSGVKRRIPRAQAGRLENSMRSTVRLLRQHTLQKHWRNTNTWHNQQLKERGEASEHIVSHIGILSRAARRNGTAEA